MRIGAVSYLNTKPLVYGLAERLPHDQLAFDLPSRLADGLTAGEYDVALIPSVEYFQNAAYSMISDACIGCRGPVLSVKLLCRRPVREIRTLALDEGSRTSAALVRILLAERYNVRPELLPLPIGAAYEQSPADAILVIGDRAIHPTRGQFVEAWDLGDVWNRWAELPFVFAMWVARPGMAAEDTNRLAAALSAARDAGEAHLESIAAIEGPAVGLSAADALSYLRDNLYFHLGSRERQGLELFRRYAAQLGLVPEPATR
jgi:chorismate dehydratase